MKEIFLVLIIVFSMLNFVSSYTIEFNQVGDKVFIIENNLSSSIEELEKTNFGYYFVKRLNASENFDSFIIKLNLDYGVVARTQEIFPGNYKTVTDGQTISLMWIYSNVSKGQDFAFFVALEDKNKSSYNWIYFIIIILLILGGLFIFKYMKNKSNENYLLDDEKKVIRLLKKADKKELWQKNIQISLGISKAKLSRLIRNLESRGLIKKISFGNANKIRL